MSSGDVRFPWNGTPDAMAAALREAEAGELGPADSVVVLSNDGEVRISTAQAHERLGQAEAVQPARERVQAAMREALTNETSMDDDDRRTMALFDGAQPVADVE